MAAEVESSLARTRIDDTWVAPVPTGFGLAAVLHNSNDQAAAMDICCLRAKAGCLWECPEYHGVVPACGSLPDRQA